MQKGDEGVSGVQELAGEITEASNASGVVDREVLGEEGNGVGKGGLRVGDAGAESERGHVAGVEAPARRRGEHCRNSDLGPWMQASAIEDAVLESAVRVPAICRTLSHLLKKKNLRALKRGYQDACGR